MSFARIEGMNVEEAVVRDRQTFRGNGIVDTRILLFRTKVSHATGCVAVSIAAVDHSDVPTEGTISDALVGKVTSESGGCGIIAGRLISLVRGQKVESTSPLSHGAGQGNMIDGLRTFLVPSVAGTIERSVALQPDSHKTKPASNS